MTALGHALPLTVAAPSVALALASAGLIGPALWHVLAQHRLQAGQNNPRPGRAGTWRAARTAALVALCTALAWRPSWPVQIAALAPAEALLLLDDSCSMRAPSAKAAGAACRYGQGRGALLSVAEQIEATAPTTRPAWATLAARQASVPPAPLALAECQPATDLLGALEQHSRSAAMPIAAAYVASDGADAGRGAWSLADDARARALSFAVHTVAVGQPLPDVAVVAVHHSEFAFVKTEVPIDVVLRSNLPSSVSADVRLWRGAQQVASQRVRTEPEQVVHFALRMDEVGTETLLATVEPAKTEAIRANNHRAFSIRVLRDKTRVLHVLGAPSFDGRFVREALRASKNIDLVSFYILRTPTNEAAISESELSLIPFPVARLFTTELKNFDVVILQNFDPRPFQMQPYLAQLSEAVRAGLGLIMLGGPHGFAEGGWHQTALQEVMPATMLPIGAAPALAAAYQPQLEPLAAAHPLLQGQQHLAQAAFWRQLAPVSLQPSGPLHPEAITLVKAVPLPDAGGQQPPAWPLLSAREVGRGRTLALATQQSWRWGFSPTSNDAAALAELWRGMLQFLLHDADSDAQLRLLVGANEPTANEPFEVAAQLLGRDYRPRANVPLVLGERWLPSMLEGDEPSAPAAVRTATTDAAGLAYFAMRAPRGGRLQLEVREAAQSSNQLAAATLAVLPSSEQDHVQPAPKWLAALSAATGGQTLSVGSEPRVLLGPSASPHVRTFKWPAPLWPNLWPVTLLLTLLLGHFWWSRGDDFSR